MENIAQLNDLLLDNDNVPNDYVIEPVSNEDYTRPVSPNEKIFGEEYRILKKIDIKDDFYTQKPLNENKIENLSKEEDEEELNEQYFNEKKKLKPTETNRYFSILNISASSLKTPCKQCFLQKCICKEFL